MGRHNARDDERIRSSLRDAAEAYQPDRQAISTRVAQGRADDRETKSLRRSMLGLRPAGAALAVVGVLVASGVAVRASVIDDQNLADPPPPAVVPAPVTSDAATSPDPTGTTGSRKPAGGPTTVPVQPTGTTGSPGTQPPASSPAAGASWLEVGGGTGKDSVATWTEKKVTLRNTSALVALKVVITVPTSADLAEAGKFTTVPNSDMTVAITPSPAGLTYTFTLRDGVKLIPGSYSFAAQFTHRSGRSAAKDSYLVQASSPSATAERTGAFA